MTLYEFNMLDDNDKYQIVWDLGKHIDTAITESHRINLYSIDKFFVEVYYNPETNKLDNIQSFIHGHSMDKYIGEVNL